MKGALRVISTTAMKPALDALAPAFERETGHAVHFSFGPSGRMAKLVAGGEPCDVAIVTAAGIDELIAQDCLVSRSDIARSVIGLAVQQGAPKPDISTVDGFADALLSARSLAMSHPTGGAQSGAHLKRIFERLGIADAVLAKATFGPGGPAGLIGNYLVRGEVEVGLQQLSELMMVPGIDVVGPIPAEVQLTTMFSAGISTAAADAALARAFIAHLRRPEAAAVFPDRGLEQVRS